MSILAIAIALGGEPALAQQPITAGDPGQPPAQPAGDQEPATDSGPATVFTPSEKIRADDAVAFPVDI